MLLLLLLLLLLPPAFLARFGGGVTVVVDVGVVGVVVMVEIDAASLADRLRAFGLASCVGITLVAQASHTRM
jgi:hypothetical protein